MAKQLAHKEQVSRQYPSEPSASRGPSWSAGLAMLFLGALQFFVMEFLTAGAWRTPRYNYLINFISDLGVVDGPVTFQGRLVLSPLGGLMDASFIALGLLGGLGILLLARSLPPIPYRGIIIFLALAFGIGAVVVGFSPEDSAPTAHVIGAFMHIPSGIALLIATGAWGWRCLPLPVWLARLLVVFGIVSVGGVVALFANATIYLGAVERVSAYPYLVTFTVLPLAGLVMLRKPIAAKR